MRRVSARVVLLLLIASLVGGCSTSVGPPPGDAVSGEEFDKLLTGLKAETFDDGKVSFLKMVSKSRGFTCEQVRRLLKEFTFDTGREEAALILYARTVDPKNFFTVLDVFTFDHSRKSLRERLP